MKRLLFNTLLLAILIAGNTLSVNGQSKLEESGKVLKNIITVGLNNADIIGSDNLAIQAAIELVFQRGGGTVKILPGEYTLFNSIYLRSNVNLTGDREKTVLKRGPAVSSPLLVDADIGQKEITPKDASAFKVGMGIVCRASNLMNDMTSTPLTITSIENGILYVNDFIQFDFTAESDSQGKGEYNGIVLNVFPMIFGFNVENVIVDGFTVDSKANDGPGWENLRIGGIYFRTCRNSVIRNVKAINTPGDGILVARTSKNILVEDCESAFNSYHGMHPGSHSTWITVQRCQLHHNGSDGLYICWGVKNSKFLDNDIHHNGIRELTNFPDRGKRGGVSIGHKDTDNLIARNHIYENARYGLWFRTKTEANGAHRNIISDNIIENNGLSAHVDRGWGIYISGITHDIQIENNIIRETRTGNERLQKNAVQIQPGVTRVQMINNKISEHPEGILIDNSKSPDNKLQIVSNP